MNTEERDKRESQSQGPRPCRPFLPRLQPNSPGNQMNQADQWRSGTFYPIPVPVPIQWSHAHSVPGFADCGQSTVMDNRRMSSASVVAGTAGNSISICSDMSSNVTMSGPFTGLLALANANSLPQATARISGTNIWPELNRRESRTHGQIDITIKSAASKTSTQQINRDYRIPEFCYYDLNMPPPATQECNIHNSSQYAPFTPDKTVRAQQQRIDTDNILANLERNHDTKAAESTGAVFKTTELELQVDNDLPSTAKSAPSKDTADEVDINKTPEKKPKRKKHRPKVINERKSRTQKQATPKPTASKDPTKPKRKYVRKKGLDKATPAKVSAASIDPSMMEGSNRSCKKALNFDNEAHPTEHGANLDSVSTAQPTRETEDMVAKKRSSIANNLLNQETEVPTSLPESLATPTEATCPPNILSANFSYIQKTGIVQCPATASHSSRTANNIIVEMGATSREIAAMRKFTSDDRNSNFTQHQVGSGMATLGEQNRVHLQRVRRTQEILAGSQPKRRKFGVEAQDNKFPSKEPKYCPQPTHANNAATIRHNSCVEAISAETSTLTRKAQKKSIVNSSCLRTQQAHAQIFAHISGDSQKDICIEVLIKQLQNLYIDKEKQHGDQQENALVLFDPVKKTPRPKVEIDEETNRVWNLLLEDINSQGIDGINEDNMKKWKEEREVFRGRANSFIARMRLVQGDRHFSPWKGSVVDSVVGVFLTQNVSDHLSSSAFMTLAAHFPRKSEEGTSTVTDETDLSISDSEDILKKPTCEKRNVTVSSIATDEENKAVNSSESSRSITGERKAADDTASSQTSVDTSVTHTAEQIVLCSNNNSEPEDATRNLNSRELHSSTSFVDLLQMQRPLFQMQGFTMPYEVYSHESTNILPKVPYAGQNQCQGTVYDYHRHQTENFRLYKSIPGEKINPSTNYQLLPNTNTGLEFQYPHMTSQKNRLSAAFKNKDRDLHCMNKERETIARAAAPSAAPCMSKITDNEDSVFSGRLPDKGTTFWPESGHDSVSRVSPDFPSRKEDAGQHEFFSYGSCNMGDVTEITSTFEDPGSREQKTAECNANLHASTTTGEAKKSRSKQENNKTDAFDWDSLRRAVESNGKKKRTDNTMDSLDWEAVRCAEVHEIAETIKERGMNRILAERIKAFLNRLVDDHGSVDLEWLRDVQPDKAKEYLLSIRGLGLKSVECVRLLTLHHLAFPVDVNVGRIAVRLGWVPLQPLPEKLQIHLLDLYPVLESIQKYLWPRLCKLDQKTLYELHYQLITFGKVFCTKNRPNCNACPMRGECRHFASAFASARLPLPGPEQKSLVNVPENGTSHQNHAATNHMPLPIPLPLPSGSEQTRKFWLLEQISDPSSIEPIIEMPGTPEPEPEEGQSLEIDIEDTWNISKGIPHIDLDIEGLKQNLQEYVREHQGGEISKALVALTSEAASIPMPQLKYVNRLRTEHQVYELPDSHPLLSHMDKREPDDPCLYLLAIWRPGETADSTEPPEKTCNSQEPGNLCDDVKCFSCNSIREANSQVVRGTLLVPCRTAMKGSFPLNGTYFQVNEVFADHESSYNPIIVPRDWLWNLPRRTVYFGTSVPSIFKGLDCKKIQHCFWRGHVCIRGFEQKTRAPRPLSLRFHCSPGKLEKGKDKMDYAGKPPKKQPDL